MTRDSDLSSDSAASGTHPSLIEGVRIGNEDAWQALVKYYQPSLVAWCRSRGLDDAATSDVLQNVWMAVARSLPKFSSSVGKGAFRAWLWRITQRRLIDFQRQQARGPTGCGGSTMLGRLGEIAADPESNVSELLIGESKQTNRSSVNEVLDRICGNYDPRTWQAFLRTARDGRTTQEVAEEFQMTDVGVRQLRSRILRRIRRELANETE